MPRCGRSSNGNPAINPLTAPGEQPGAHVRKAGDPAKYWIFSTFPARTACDWRLADECSFPPSGSFPGSYGERRKAAEQARAANIRQGYVYDPALEEATARYVAGDITREEYRQLMIEPPVR